MPVFHVIIWAATRENQQCGFLPGLTQTRLHSHWRWLEAWNFVCRKKRYCTIQVAKTKALISFAVTAKLICVFVFAYADCWFSHDTALSAKDWLRVQISFKPNNDLKYVEDHKTTINSKGNLDPSISGYNLFGGKFWLISPTNMTNVLYLAICQFVSLTCQWQEFHEGAFYLSWISSSVSSNSLHFIIRGKFSRIFILSNVPNVLWTVYLMVTSLLGCFVWILYGKIHRQSGT